MQPQPDGSQRHASLVGGAGDTHCVSATGAPASTHVTVRSRVPSVALPAQLHAPQSPACHSGVAQDVVLQLCVSLGRGAGQRASSSVAPSASTQVTVRAWVPPPQVALQAPKSPTSQRSQGVALQSSVVAGAGLVAHADSGSGVRVASTQVTVRTRVPVPHATLQGPKSLLSHVPAGQVIV